MNKKILIVGGCGYIGSFLRGKMLKDFNYEVDVCDRLERGNPDQIFVKYHNYEEMTCDQISEYSSVLWFAGHSSVQMAIADPEGAINNNCLNLFNFAKKINTDKTKFIYASTGSLYSQLNNNDIKPTKETELIHIPDQNPYDISKFAFDYMATHFLKNFYAIRMGTLAGYSKNIRPELLFNAMNISASQNGVLYLKNKDSFRTILLLDDLWLLIKALIEDDHPSGVYNAGSFSGKIGFFAEKIAKLWGAKIIDEGVSKTYSFLLDIEKMRTIVNVDRSDESFDNQSKELIRSLKLTK